MPQAHLHHNQVTQGRMLAAGALDLIEGHKGDDIAHALNEEFGRTPLFERVLDGLGDGDRTGLLETVAAGAQVYRLAHGFMPDADMLAAAVQQGAACRQNYTMDGGREMVLDSTEGSMDTASIQANRAMSAVMDLFESAAPFTATLPTDVNSNEARLIVLEHVARSNLGGYKIDDLLNGSAIGRPFADSERELLFPTAITAPVTLKFTSRNNAQGTATDPFGLYCDQALPGVPVVRGQTIVLVNGIPVAEERRNPQGANSPLVGSIKLGDSEYTITGSVAPDSGDVTISSVSPALPDGTQIKAIGNINYERAAALTPEVGFNVRSFSMFANTSRINVTTGIDASQQIIRELGIDAQAQQLRAARAQASMERYHRALRRAYDLSINTVLEHDFRMADRDTALVRAQIWLDFAPVLTLADHLVSEKTMDHGVGFCYVGRRVASELRGLPPEIFRPSGLTSRPGIWRVGRLLDMVDVYHLPDSAGLLAANEVEGEYEMLLIGRGTDPSRSPVVTGDAVPPMLVDQARGKDMASNAGVYARGFVRSNPHLPSAQGCARIRLKGLK